MHFSVRWPDGTESRCYSPSLAVCEHLEPGTSYPLAEFVARSREALTIASERVRQRYGFACSRALGQLEAIERQAQGFAGAGSVSVLAFHRDPA